MPGSCALVIVLARRWWRAASRSCASTSGSSCSGWAGWSGRAGPGVTYVIPVIEKARARGLRTMTMDVPAQDVITKDNVSVKVNAVLYFRVIDPNRAVVEVENYLFATSQNAQTTLRSVCGEVELDELLAEREKINTQLQTIIDQHTEPWGIKVVQVAIKHIDLPEEMRRAMARQAEAERERRAKVIAAEGEFQAAQRLAEAAAIMATRADHDPAPLPADARGDRHREQLDDDLPGADRPAPPVARARGEGRRAERMQLGDLVYELPPELIAQEPAPERDGGAPARPRAATRPRARARAPICPRGCGRAICSC